MKRHAILLAVLALGGCATAVDSHMLKTDAATGTAVDGLPFRQRVPLIIELYQKTEKGYELVATKEQTLADPLHVAVLNFHGDVLANADIKISMAPDSSLTTVDLKSSSQAAKGITDVSKAALDASKALADLKVAEAKAKTDAADKLEAQTAAGSAQEVSVAKAITAAMAAQDELDELPAGTLKSVRTRKEGEIKELKMLANEAARKAGLLTRPFPDV